MDNFQQKLGYQFNDLSVLEQALTHVSCNASRNNERMEFLGDALLNFVIAELLFTSFRTHTEGKMSRTRSALVNQQALVIIGRQLGIEKLLRYGPLSERHAKKEAMVADCMEAVFAAIYMESGLEAARQVIVRHADSLLRNRSVSLQKDPKSRLQEHLQAQKLLRPEYTRLDDGQGRGGGIRVSCTLPGLGIRTTAVGETKKQAETRAAEKALALLEASEKPAKPV